MPPMAPCGTYVSLLRSCYSTTMRFFKDDLSIETPVSWYFLPGNPKWCGLPNVFNSRNWYGGVPFWPDLGEVEGSSRPWANGKGAPQFVTGPFGTADQWLNGSLVADSVSVDPCPPTPPIVPAFPFPENGGFAGFDPPPPLYPLIANGPDMWWFDDGLIPPFVYAIIRQPGPAACGYPSPGQWGIIENTLNPATFFPLPQFFSPTCDEYTFTALVVGYSMYPNPYP